MALNVYENKRKVSVEPFAGSAIQYGFMTNVSAATSTSCGHQAIGATTPPGLVFGANAPKPGRASRKRADGTDSSFYDYAVYFQLIQEGWSVKLPRRRRGGVNRASRAVYVTVAGIKYAWNMPNDTRTKIGADFAGLGINEATSNDGDLVWGASSPKPPVAKKVQVGEGGTDVISTFVDPARADGLPEGWTSSERVQIA
jgi:hypothetical protein